MPFWNRAQTAPELSTKTEHKNIVAEPATPDLAHGVFDAMASRLAIFTGDSAVLCLFTRQDRREANMRRKATTRTTIAGSVAGSTFEPRSATRLFTFDLRWPSGTLIKHFEEFDESVERFTQDMDEGLIERVPRAATDLGGNWLESYNLVWGTRVLQDGQWLSYYDIPQGATLTVLRYATSHASEVGVCPEYVLL